jgi:hypothetical protein
MHYFVCLSIVLLVAFCHSIVFDCVFCSSILLMCWWLSFIPLCPLFVFSFEAAFCHSIVILCCLVCYWIEYAVCPSIVLFVLAVYDYSIMILCWLVAFSHSIDYAFVTRLCPCVGCSLSFYCVRLCSLLFDCDLVLVALCHSIEFLFALSFENALCHSIVHLLVALCHSILFILYASCHSGVSFVAFGCSRLFVDIYLTVFCLVLSCIDCAFLLVLVMYCALLLHCIVVSQSIVQSIGRCHQSSSLPTHAADHHSSRNHPFRPHSSPTPPDLAQPNLQLVQHCFR